MATSGDTGEKIQQFKVSSLEEIEEQKRKDGKVDMEVPLLGFLATVGIGVPFWLSILLPWTITYQLLKPILPSSGKKGGDGIDAAPVQEEDGDVATIPPLKDRKYDLVLLGATGFTGGLAFRHLCRTYGVGGEVKWAIAGRSKDKLERIKADVSKELGNTDVLKVDTLIVDTANRETLPGLVRDTRVVATTAGPFGSYGSPVVEFCAKYGTSYVDTTGEVDWTKEMISKWDDVAQKNGANIVSFCGHDSMPWDLTVSKISDILERECGDEVVEVECMNDLNGGGVSGGTLATVYAAIDGGKPQKDSRLGFNPLYKLPDGSQSRYKTKVKSVMLVERPHQPRFSSSRWTTFFVMAAINGEIVKRSNALRCRGNLSVTYREGMLCRDFKTGLGTFLSLAILGTGLLNPITGSVLKRLLPKPGEGPTVESMDQGHLCVYGYGVGSKGSKVETALYFPNDAGYKDTARMLVESGLCLALEADKLSLRGGFYTPSSMGDVLLGRLCKTGTMFGYKIVEK